MTFTFTFPVAILFIGAILFFIFAFRLPRFKVPERSPASRAHLSVEQRQQKIKLASWLCVGSDCFMLAGAAVLLWLQKSS